MTDVEKLIERLEDCVEANMSEHGPVCCRSNMRQAAAMLRSLADRELIQGSVGKEFPCGEPSPSPAIGDVEKLIERLGNVASINEYGYDTCKEAAAMLRSLKKENDGLWASNREYADECEALAAEKAKVEEQANNLKRYVGEYASEIDALRAKLERAREGLQTIASIQVVVIDGYSAPEIARATLEELK